MSNMGQFVVFEHKICKEQLFSYEKVICLQSLKYLFTFPKSKKYFFPSKASVVVILVFKWSGIKVALLTLHFNVLFSFCVAVFSISSFYFALPLSWNVVSLYGNANALSSAYHGSKFRI